MFVWQKAMFADQSSERGGRQLVEVPLSSLPNQSSAGLPFKQASFFFEMLIRGRPALFTASPLSQKGSYRYHIISINNDDHGNRGYRAAE